MVEVIVTIKNIFVLLWFEHIELNRLLLFHKARINKSLFGDCINEKEDCHQG